MVLHLAVLNRRSVVPIVQLDAEDSGRSGFVLGCFQAQPEVDIPGQNSTLGLFGLQWKVF